LGEIEGISFIYFTRGDVVRHVLVQHIVKAYEKYEKKRREGDAENTVA
jgi:phosphate starvation-inducible PhoH-like protein